MTSRKTAIGEFLFIFTFYVASFVKVYSHSYINPSGIKRHEERLFASKIYSTFFFHKSIKTYVSIFRRLYSTQRNATKTLQEWRQQLPWKVADVIQDQCEEPMRELGYKMAANSTTLLNTANSLFIDHVKLKRTWLGNYLLTNDS